MGAPARISIQANKLGPEIPASMYGIFYEEINHAGDGGLYAELIQNRSFEETVPIEGCELVDGKCRAFPGEHYRSGTNKNFEMPWKFSTPWPGWFLETGGGKAEISLQTNDTINLENVNYLRVAVAEAGPQANIRLLNEGFWGINTRAGEKYELSFFARASAGFDGRLTVGLLGQQGKVLAQKEIRGVTSGSWKKYTASFSPSGSDTQARFFLQPHSAGTLDLDVVSLFPAKTYKDHPNGMRPDIAKLLEGMKPAFMRFPGGCYVEGATFANRYRWKETIGDVSQRPGHWCLWKYRSTDGLGYHEYLQLCEDIGAQAMYVINVGLSCEFRHGDFIPESQLQEYVQDALDAIEYALGTPSSKWGRVRAQNGHAKPFPLKYVEIGNENHGERYRRHYNVFYKAIKGAWPELTLILNTGTGEFRPEDGQGVDKIEMADEHFYRNPEWMFDNFGRYDATPRDRGFTLYVGEYACNKNVGKGNLLAALSEAAFMMGMERNSDVVKMTSYAPLFFNVNRLDWPVNMIGYDSAVAFGRSTYYVQKLFTLHRPDVNVATAFEMQTASVKPAFVWQIGLGTYGTSAEFKDLKVEVAGKEAYAADFVGRAGEWKPSAGQWSSAPGGYAQTSEDKSRIMSWLDARMFTNYTLTVKARKVSGTEGFLIGFGRQPNEYYHLNLGGFKNTRHAFEKFVPQTEKPGTTQNGSIQPGRWYDIKLVVNNDRVQAFLDGKQVSEIMGKSAARFFAIAGLDRKAGEVVIKVVNGNEAPVTSQVSLAGVKNIKPQGRIITLSGKLTDENDVQNPTRITPLETSFNGFQAEFSQTFPPASLTILRIKAK
jgi:alpha-L-arabinofuranosidase